MEPFRQKRFFYGIVKHLYFYEYRDVKFNVNIPLQNMFLSANLGNKL